MGNSYPFVKLNRYIINDDIFKNEKALKFYVWLLCKATYKESDIFVGKQKVHLNKGEIVFGLNSATKELNMSIQNIRTILKTLKITEKITIKSTNKFSIITLLDKEIFSWNENLNNNQLDQNYNNQTNNNKENIDTKKIIRFLYANGLSAKSKPKNRSFAAYDLDLYQKMLSEDGC